MQPLRLVLLGDSIAYGTGAQRAQDALGRRLADVLAADGFRVELSVLAVPGAVSADLAGQIRRVASAVPDLAVVLVGANDLARFVPPEEAGRSLAAAVGELRETGADVVVVPAPDMSAVPWVPAAYRPIVAAASRRLQAYQAAVSLQAGASVAEVADVGRAFAADSRLFSADRFHPSSAGYAVIAAALAPTVLAVARARRDGRAA